MRPFTAARHTGGAVLEGLLILGILAVLAFGAGILVRGGPAGASSVLAGRESGHLTVPDAAFGSTVDALANPGTDGTWVKAECSQNGVLVYRQYSQVDPATHLAALKLGPTPSWLSGGASCNAEEGTWFKGSRWRVVASTTFEVSG